MRLTNTTWSGQWAELVLQVTMQRWNRFSVCCRTTSLTGATWATREELRLAIVTWIERTYHRRRRQARLGRLTPVEYEVIMYEQVALAA